MRHPAAWAFPLLTKVTTGVGVLWFAFRRDWRSLGIAIGATAVIVLAIEVALVLRRFPITREDHAARLAALDAAARADPDASGMHP